MGQKDKESLIAEVAELTIFSGSTFWDTNIVLENIENV